MHLLSVLLIVVGIIGVAIGGIGMLIAGFQESLLWGIGMLVVPIVSLIFVLTRWQEAKKPFLVQVVGWVILLLGLALQPD